MILDKAFSHVESHARKIVCEENNRKYKVCPDVQYRSRQFEENI